MDNPERESFELETINKMYLELSQFATATTAKERALINALVQAYEYLVKVDKTEKYPNDQRENLKHAIKEALKKVRYIE